MDLQKILNQGQQQMLLSEQLPEQQMYRIENVSVNISSAYHQLNFDNCRFQATQTTVALILSQTQETQKVLTFTFINMSSVGLQSGNIMVFMQGQQNEDEGEGQENPMPQIFKLIQQSSQGTFNLNGNLTVSLDFKGQPQDKKKQIYDFLVSNLQSNDNDDDQNFMDEMISADQINEDGTINNFNINPDQDEEESDADDIMQEEDKQ